MIHRFGAVDSTQDLAHLLAARGAAAGTIVVGARQLKGRGTRGRSWSSGPGGLWLSAILRPPAPTAEGLSLRVGLELAEALSDLTVPERVDLKWPNDLMARDRKLGGILVEARWAGSALAWIVVGVGLNLTNELPAELGGSAIRLADLIPSVDPATVEAIAIEAIGRAGRTAGGRFSAAELERFARRDWLRGRAVETPVRGTAVGVDADGRLMVAAPDGETVTITSPVAVVGLAAGTEGA